MVLRKVQREQNILVNVFFYIRQLGDSMNLDPLQKRLVKTCVYLQRLEQEKKYRNGVINEDIKGCKARIEALSKALDNGNMDHLNTVFEGEELESILRELQGAVREVQGESDTREHRSRISWER